MDKATKDLIGQLVVVGAVIAGGFYVYRKFIKPEEKSSFRGRKLSNRKVMMPTGGMGGTLEAVCLCQESGSGQGYSQPCPCAAGDAELDRID